MAEIITNFSQVSQETLACFLSRRPDVLAQVYWNHPGSGSDTDAEIRAGLDEWWGGTPERQGYTLGEFLQRMQCPVSYKEVPSATAPPPSGVSNIISGSTGKYLLLAGGAFLLLKMARIL